MVGSVPEPLGQSSNELFIDEPHCFQGYLAQSLMQTAGNWQVRPCSQEPWAAWGFGVPDSIIQDVRQAGAAARGHQYSLACTLLPLAPAGEGEPTEGGGTAAV